MPASGSSRTRPALSFERKTPRQEEAILEATWAYYHDGLNQNEIATRLGVSRASVVNYLTEARKREYVRITINSEIFLNHELSHALRARFGLVDALVVPADPTGPAGTADRAARACADWLPSLLEPGDALGVAWGETIYRVAEAAPHLAMDGVTVVQLVGSRPAGLGFAAEVCSATIARHFGAECINLHAPLLLSESDLAERLRAEPIIAEQLAAVETCNKVLFACGTVGPESHIARTRMHDAPTMDRLRGDGAVGVICARLIDRDGRAMPTDIDERMIGITLDQMRAKKMGLLVATGAERVAGARASILGGYATHLVTCAETAKLLLEDTS